MALQKLLMKTHCI